MLFYLCFVSVLPKEYDNHILLLYSTDDDSEDREFSEEFLRAELQKLGYKVYLREQVLGGQG